MKKEKNTLRRAAVQQTVRRTALSALAQADQARQEGETAGAGKTESPQQEAENRLQNEVLQPLANTVEMGAFAVSGGVRKQVMRKTAMKQKLMEETRQRTGAQTEENSQPPTNSYSALALELQQPVIHSPQDGIQAFPQMEVYPAYVPDTPKSTHVPSEKTAPLLRRSDIRRKAFAKEAKRRQKENRIFTPEQEPAEEQRSRTGNAVGQVYKNAPFEVEMETPFQNLPEYTPEEKPASTEESILVSRRKTVRRTLLAKEAKRRRSGSETPAPVQTIFQEESGAGDTAQETPPATPLAGKGLAEKRTEKTAKNMMPAKGAVGEKNATRAVTSRADKGQQVKRQHILRTAVQRHQQGKSKAPYGRLIHSPAHYKHRPLRIRPQNSLRRVWEKLRAALGNMARRALQSSLAALCAGGIVLMLVLVVGAAAVVVGSPMGILFADQTNDPNAHEISDVVQETNAAFAQAVNDLANAYPEADEVDIQYYYANGGTWASYWPEVLAVFAVHTTLNTGSDAVVIDDAKAQMMRDVFWDMNELSADMETVTVSANADNEGNQNGNTNNAAAPQERHVLHIAVTGKTADEMADGYHFTADQRDILHQLLGAEMKPMLVALCGSIMPGGMGGAPGLVGNLLWPLPGYTTITTHFGEPDAIRGLPHRGVDIAAPEGTPILAVHGGTVLVSGWNDSYGNNVLLDDGAGVSTRYAHMVSTAVQAGDIVSAGDVRGYVGSTGDSTGNHLHLELKINGVFADPEQPLA